MLLFFCYAKKQARQACNPAIKASPSFCFFATRFATFGMQFGDKTKQGCCAGKRSKKRLVCYVSRYAVSWFVRLWAIVFFIKKNHTFSCTCSLRSTKKQTIEKTFVDGGLGPSEQEATRNAIKKTARTIRPIYLIFKPISFAFVGIFCFN
jgi:hypothetical protein